MIERILVALDGSEPADKALDFALDLAEKYSAEIVLLSVIPPVAVPTTVYAASGARTLAPVVTEKHLKEVEDRYEKVLSEALKKANEIKPSLNVSTKLVEGRPSERIVETAKEGSFDIVVMGSRGLGGIKGFFLGSASDRVADEAACPVLIVK